MKVLQAFRYIGGKYRLAPWIISHMPEHKLYVEPMGGSGAVLLSKPRSHGEVYNDIDNEIVNFMLQVRDNFDPLFEKVISTPFSRQLVAQWKQEFMQNNTPRDDIERAARWFSVQEASYVGVWGSGWLSYIGAARYLVHHRIRLKEVALRLQGVAFECEDYRVTVGKYDNSKTLFYFDPPYLLEDGSNSDYFAPYLQRERFSHAGLSELLIGQGLEGKWMLTYYDLPIIRKMYDIKGIYSITKEQSVSSSLSKDKPKLKRMTILLANFPLEENHE